MLAAKKSKWFEEIFAVYNRNLLIRRFHSFKISGLEHLKNKSADVPLLIYANHTSWWDGLLAFEISRRAKLDSYIMMDEANLKRYFLFRRLGAFSVPKSSRRAIESIRYSAKLLTDNPQRTLWIFPQGKIVPNDRRPILFHSGAARIVGKIGECLTVPLVFRLEFTGEFKPEIFVKVGKTCLIRAGENYESKKTTVGFSEKIAQLLDELKSDIINEETEKFCQIF